MPKYRNNADLEYIAGEARVALVHVVQLAKSLADVNYELSVPEGMAVADTLASVKTRLRDVLSQLEDHACVDNVPAPLEPLDDINYALVLYAGGAWDWTQASIVGFTSTRDQAESMHRARPHVLTQIITVSELAEVMP